jgi:ACT domain-containing protein
LTDQTNQTIKKKMGDKQLKFLEILEKNMGLVTPACKKFGNLSRSTHYKWMREFEGYKERVETIEDGNIDFAEGKLMEQMNEGNIAAILFYLKCKAKTRGYIERQEIKHSGGVSIDVKWEE